MSKARTDFRQVIARVVSRKIADSAPTGAAACEERFDELETLRLAGCMGSGQFLQWLTTVARVVLGSTASEETVTTWVDHCLDDIRHECQQLEERVS
jgi:hypothetical protein